ncbi:MAG: hypothetical protein ACP5VN_06705 [Acidobacteriota bacterium]
MRGRWVFALGLVAVALAAAAPVTLPINKAGQVQYMEVVEVPGAPQAKVMEKARLWLASHAHTPEDVTQGEQPHCIMVGDSFEVAREGMPITVFFTLAFEAKDHQLCATVGALRVFDGSVQRPLEYYLNKDGSPRVNPWLAESVDRQARAFLADLSQALTAGSAPSKT